MKTTVLGESSAQVSEKRSRFIAVCRHCETEEEALAFIEQKRKECHDARHNVFAFTAGAVSRYSDDGEPHGTAGKPIADLISGMELEDVAVVVTRYFGGVLLGTGGLMRAYSAAAKEALERAEKAKKSVFLSLSVVCPYPEHGKLLRFLEEQNAVIGDTAFGQEITVTAFVNPDQFENFCAALMDRFAGRLCAVRGEEKTILKKLS